MKKINRLNKSVFTLLFAALLLPFGLKAQDDTQQKIINGSVSAKAALLKGDPSMQNLFTNSYGYAIFPSIGKGGLGVGGAAGKGAVYEQGSTVGTAQMVQVTIGFQAGGQAYREVIFFQNKEALDRFKENKVEFSAQTSAVAVKTGASASANYRDGVVVFTQSKKGLMLEASLGGQKFTYKPLK